MPQNSPDCPRIHPLHAAHHLLQSSARTFGSLRNRTAFRMSSPRDESAIVADEGERWVLIQKCAGGSCGEDEKRMRPEEPEEDQLGTSPVMGSWLGVRVAGPCSRRLAEPATARCMVEREQIGPRRARFGNRRLVYFGGRHDGRTCAVYGQLRLQCVLLTAEGMRARSAPLHTHFALPVAAESMHNSAYVYESQGSKEELSINACLSLLSM